MFKERWGVVFFFSLDIKFKNNVSQLSMVLFKSGGNFKGPCKAKYIIAMN